MTDPLRTREVAAMFWVSTKTVRRRVPEGSLSMTPQERWKRGSGHFLTLMVCQPPR